MTTMKNKKNISSIILMTLGVLATLASSQRITEFQVKTASEEHANMDENGEIGFDFINKRFKVCSIDILDNPGLNDFERGHINAFWGSMLGDCDKFELPDGELPLLRANHRGEDAIVMEYVRILLSDGTYLECPVNVPLDNFDSRTLRCTRPGGERRKDSDNNTDDFSALLSELEPPLQIKRRTGLLVN